MIWVGLLTILGAFPLISGRCEVPVDPANRRLFAIDAKNGPFVNGTYPEGTGAYFRCELGFGSRIVYHPSVCQANGEWTQTARCEVTCPPLILEYGEVAYNTSLLYDELYLTTGYSVETLASFSCNEFHDRHGSSSVICQNSGNWSEHIPICNASTCGEPDIPANGILHSTSRNKNSYGEYPHGTEAIFRRRTDNGRTFCHSFCQAGNWSVIFPLIGILNGCDHPTDLTNRRLFSINYKNGPRVNGKYPEGTGAYFRCELGFGSRIIYHPSVCQPNGDWIPTSRCEVTCPPLILENGEVAYNTHLLYDDIYLMHGYSVDTIATFSCDEFYSREGASSLICQRSGYWSQPTPICNATECSSVSHPENGKRITGDDGRQPAGASVTFACDLLYQLNGSATITCQSNGEWNSSVPTCTAVPCPNPTVDNGSSTVAFFIKPPLNDGFFFEYTFLEFECDSGYTLFNALIPGYKYSLCLPNGMWDPTIPTCILEEV